MKECSKSITRRLSDSNYLRKYFVGHGIDIGGKPDPLALYREFFPGVLSLKTWDWEDGDAQFMHGVPDEHYDFVFSSHCLEHLKDPAEGLKSWFRITKPGGHMIFSVPDEDLYEQGEFPSRYNKDHKTTWTIMKSRSWSATSKNLLEFLSALGPSADIRKLEAIDATYRYSLPPFDQTLTPIAECSLEAIVRKRPQAEIKAGGVIRSPVQPDQGIRIHLNQYKADQKTLRSANSKFPPFGDDSEI